MNCYNQRQGIIFDIFNVDESIFYHIIPVICIFLI